MEAPGPQEFNLSRSEGSLRGLESHKNFYRYYQYRLDGILYKVDPDSYSPEEYVF